MKNKLLPIVFSAIMFVLNQVSLGDCGNLDCSCPEPSGCFSNWYIGGSGSIAWHNNHDFTDIVNFSDTIKTSRDYKVGGGAAASLGYFFNVCDCWELRLEGEVIWRRNSLKSQREIFIIDGVPLVDDTFPANGYTQDIGLMVNCIADFPLYSDYVGYIGGGGGISFNQLVMTSVDNTPIPLSKNKDELFAWQVMGGIYYNICSNIAFTVGYRLFGTQKVETPNLHLKSKNIPLTQSVDIGILFRL